MLAEERALTRDRSCAVPLKAEAFAAVVEEHWQAVYRLLHSLSGNVHETEDLTQETFLRALQRLASFQPGTNMRNWLMRIASNAFFDVRRKRKRAKAQPLAAEPAHAEHPVGHELEVAEQGALAKIAMEDLTELTRLVFHLRATEHLSFREIAEIAGTTEQSARWHMHEARKRLLERMGDNL